ncbi:hypothetical protein UA08_03904 [Talaromyces atroroseus]|uniref:molybdopterin adenylyltransferase n=1 Tax=Talaromyces atroroseus TaxID=1441469 RepID=A0A225B6M3_TALAT|nr:hypothetical protein UA08_03904 [Talaromyces atroroseus]OKL61557.1 hypothetical protein UA08_03904 [Talaromyces atroroseus]
MAITYSEAIDIIHNEAAQHRRIFQLASETVPLSRAVNRITRDRHCSSERTPRWDTSAMDGFAVSSTTIQTASREAPVVCRIKETIAAGDVGVTVTAGDDQPVCAEIMTGARFPAISRGEPFNCCVPREDTVVLDNAAGSEERVVHILKPARANQHRRLAGEDFQPGDTIIEAHTVIKPNHIMALASIPCTSVDVLKQPRIAVFSTGSELLTPSCDVDPNYQLVADTNGPYISTALDRLGCEVDFLGIIPDNAAVAADKISYHLMQQRYDMVITTGAVSAGKFDFIPKALEYLGAQVLFHKVAMRPGHPVLFAKFIPERGMRQQPSPTPFFGLPGNPIAAAACLHFLVRPYLRTLLLQDPEEPLLAVVETDPNEDQYQSINEYNNHKVIASFKPDKDIFYPGTRLQISHRSVSVQIVRDYSSAKIRPFLRADCWVHIPRGKESLYAGDQVHVYPMR